MDVDATRLPAARLPAMRATAYWLTQYRRTWRGSLVSGFGAPLLYLAAIGYGLGTLVDRDGPGRVAGVAYVAFVAPGVLAAHAMQTAIGEATYPVMAAIRWTRQYHAMLATPLGVGDVLLGHVGYIVVRLVMVGSAFAGIGLAVGAFASARVLVAVPVAVLCGVVHALPVMALAARIERADAFSVVFRMISIPLFLFAGTFFPVEQLPAPVRALAMASPLWHATSACRDIVLATVSTVDMAVHLGYLGACAAGGLWLARRCYRWRLAS